MRRKEHEMDVYKKWSFYSPLTGLRTVYPAYPVGTGFESMEELSDFILEDVSAHGKEFEVDAGEEGKMVFKKGGMYEPEIIYTW
jgi:hypothetical protein